MSVTARLKTTKGLKNATGSPSPRGRTRAPVGNQGARADFQARDWLLAFAPRSLTHKAGSAFPTCAPRYPQRPEESDVARRWSINSSDAQSDCAAPTRIVQFSGLAPKVESEWASFPKCETCDWD